MTLMEDAVFRNLVNRVKSLEKKVVELEEDILWVESEIVDKVMIEVEDEMPVEKTATVIETIPDIKTNKKENKKNK